MTQRMENLQVIEIYLLETFSTLVIKDERILQQIKYMILISHLSLDDSLSLSLHLH